MSWLYLARSAHHHPYALFAAFISTDLVKYHLSSVRIRLGCHGSHHSLLIQVIDDSLASSDIHVGSTNTHNVSGNTCLIALKVLDELLSQLLCGLLVCRAVGPAVNGAENLGVDTEALAGNLEVEPLH